MQRPVITPDWWSSDEIPLVLLTNGEDFYEVDSSGYNGMRGIIAPAFVMFSYSSREPHQNR